MKETFTVFLKCDFTDAEKADFGSELARASVAKKSLEDQKKEVDAQLKADIVAQETIIARLAQSINTGSEFRNIECRVELDTPEPGKKRVIRLDTGEEVYIKPMTDSDRQMVLDLQSKAEAAEAEAEKAKAPIVTPPPMLPRLEAGEPLQGPGVSLTPELMDALDKILPANGPTLAPARTQGGTHQRGTPGRKPRNKEAESFADGSVEDPAEEREYAPEEGAE